MNVAELKNKCNADFDRAMTLMENDGDVKQVRALLLDVAQRLVDIGKLSSVDRVRCGDKARLVLEATRQLVSKADFPVVYRMLTGSALSVSNVPQTAVGSDTNAPSNMQSGTQRNSKAQNAHKQSGTNATADKDGDNGTDVGAKPTPNNFIFKWDELPTISFDDVAGLEDVKNTVKNKVLLPLTNPDLYKGYVKKGGGGILMYGPPGTGKTMIAAATAREIGAKFCAVGPSDLLTQGFGNSEKLIAALFKEARSFPCSVIYFDELDSICPVKTGSQYARQVRSELLRQMQGMESYGEETGHILLMIGATNKPWDVDPAFIRPGRLGARIYVGLPDSEARRYMVTRALDKIKKAAIVDVCDDIDVDGVVARTEGFNGADVGNLMDKVQELSIERANATGVKTIEQADFDNAFAVITSSVQQTDIDKLDDWRRQNG